MKAYATQSICNVGIAGHGDTGKTQLVSSLLFTAGMTTRLGKVVEGTTVTDWDEEEIARKITIHTGLAFAEWAGSGQSEKIKINFLDTPGYSTFINDTRASLVAADAALIVVDAVAGVQVVTEKVWDYAIEYDLPRAFVINWMDRELADFERAMESITHVFGRNAVPVQLPIGAEKQFRGVVDLITMKAHLYTPDGDGKPRIEDIPADMADAAKAAHEALVETVAEGDDALMENRNGLIVKTRLTKATGTAEGAAALEMVEEVSGEQRVTMGGDKGYDQKKLVEALRRENVTPHVARNQKRPGGSAIDGRTTRHAGYAISQRVRKRVEEIFGWMKTIGLLRKLRHRGEARVEWMFTFTAAAYNLVRARNLLAQAAV